MNSPDYTGSPRHPRGCGNSRVAACDRITNWLDCGETIGVAVNISARSIADTALLRLIEDVLRYYDLPSRLLTLELTESSVHDRPAKCLPALRRMHSQGITLSVDNFGTGFSSLAYLRQLPVDEVKIDRSFVFGMSFDLGDLAVVRAVIELGHALGPSVVAEGVENSETLDQLGATGCDTAQGHHVSRPVPPDEFDTWARMERTTSYTEFNAALRRRHPGR